VAAKQWRIDVGSPPGAGAAQSWSVEQNGLQMLRTQPEPTWQSLLVLQNE
jgi:hypothetical protein